MTQYWHLEAPQRDREFADAVPDFEAALGLRGLTGRLPTAGRARLHTGVSHAPGPSWRLLAKKTV